MNVLICDDDLKIVQQIKKFLLKLSKQSTYNFEVPAFQMGILYWINKLKLILRLLI